jgi:CRISPR-associated endonuclease/helicase Cas3
MEPDHYLSFWGKAQPDAAASHTSHAVAYHGLDVAAAALALIDSGVVKVPALFRGPGLERSIAALIALHDIGKFTRSFQCKSPDHWPPQLGPLKPPPAFPHDLAGFALFNDSLHDLLDPLLADWLHHDERMSLINAVCGHHGRPVDSAQDLPSNVADAACLGAARAFTAEVIALFGANPLPCLEPGGSPEVIWWFAGLTVLADWIGSSQSWFPYRGCRIDLPTYWRTHALPQAAEAINQAGLRPSRPRVALSLSELLGSPATPSPVQHLAETADLGGDEPVLVLVEDQTGSGKTEAALLLAHRLMASGRADGLFVALPTMATANAMYARLAQAYRRLFDPAEQPSLVLTHGRSRDHAAFQDSILAAAAGAPNPRAEDPADEPASAQCAAWIADDRRRGFLASVGVGTIDQALLAVLPTRHAPLRLLGLHRKVLLIDEAHAYDAYMSEELMRLVTFHAGLGGSTIILSATLPQTIRRRLVAAISDSQEIKPPVPVRADYPMMTIQCCATLAEIPCAGRVELARSVSVERLAHPDEALAEIVRAAAQGLAVAWIRNAVDDAAEAHAALALRGVAATLFHARFAMGDRMAIEAEVVARAGKHSRDRAGVIVSTQVIEQSLDLDFDLIVTDLAPMDLLIQRAGRLWRHDRERPAAARRRMLVLAPEPVAEPGADWLGTDLRRTGAVYDDHALLWRTARILFAAGAISAPGDIRRLVEEAYARDGDLPSGLQGSAMRAEGRRASETSVARQNLLCWRKAYTSSEPWASDIATPTRLGEESLTLRLARWDGASLAPWFAAETEARSWALSEIQVARRLVSGVPEAAGTLAAEERRVRSGWGAWERDIPIVPLVLSGDDFRATVLKTNAQVLLSYHGRLGLRV